VINKRKCSIIDDLDLRGIVLWFGRAQEDGLLQLTPFFLPHYSNDEMRWELLSSVHSYHTQGDNVVGYVVATSIREIANRECVGAFDIVKY
jgi:hypothetical protein